MKKRIEPFKAIVTIGAILVLMVGCATRDKGRYPLEQGWHPGFIVQVGSATTDFPKTPVDCRRAEFSGEGAAQDYAYVHLANTHEGGKYFNSNSKLRHVIVRIRLGTSFRKGDLVYVNIRDCTQFAS